MTGEPVSAEWKLSADAHRTLKGCLMTMWRDAQGNAAIKTSTVPLPYRILTHEGHHLTLREAGLKAEDDMTTHLRSMEKLGKIFSKREIDRRIQDVFWKMSVATTETVDKLAEAAVDSLEISLRESPTEWTLFLPISNLTSEGTFSLGKATFHPYSQMDVIIKRISDFLKREFVGGDSMKRDFENCSIAEAKVTCVDVDQAKALAERDIADALCVLRCLSGTAYRHDNKYIDFKGKIWAGTVNYTAFSAREVSQGSSRIGYLIPIGLRSKYAEDPTIMRLDSLLRKDPTTRTDLEARLITSIRTFGLALNETTDRDCFITAISSLEALMTDDRDPKKETLAERTAHLIGTKGQNKRDIYGRMKDLYAIRSDLVHGEERNISEADVPELIEFGQACILRALDLTDKLTKAGDFIAWFEEQKFPN